MASAPIMRTAAVFLVVCILAARGGAAITKDQQAAWKLGVTNSQGQPGYNPAVVPKDGSLTLSWPQGKTHGVWRVPTDSCPPFPFQVIEPNQVPKVPPQDGGSFTIMCPDNEVKYYACPVEGHCTPGGLLIKVTCTDEFGPGT